MDRRDCMSDCYFIDIIIGNKLLLLTSLTDIVDDYAYSHINVHGLLVVSYG